MHNGNKKFIQHVPKVSHYRALHVLTCNKRLLTMAMHFLKGGAFNVKCQLVVGVNIVSKAVN